jgi:predicted regulator of amino acid metabolism with ACT domain
MFFEVVVLRMLITIDKLRFRYVIRSINGGAEVAYAIQNSDNEFGMTMDELIQATGFDRRQVVKVIEEFWEKKYLSRSYQKAEDWETRYTLRYLAKFNSLYMVRPLSRD